MKYQQETKEHTVEDAEGNITTTTTTKTKAILKNDEPDYIKLYTKMWCEFNMIPDKWRPLFFALVCRMSYASLKDETGGQIVHTIGSTGKAIIEECGWKNKDTLYRGLQALCECEAIKKISRGEYQINPQYAGKGPWHYNAKENRGGVSELVAKFDFKNKNTRKTHNTRTRHERTMGNRTQRGGSTMNHDLKDTAGYLLQQQIERNEAFFRRQRQLERERREQEKERKTNETHTDS